MGEVSDLECKTHENRVCKPTYREECKDVKETRTVCNDVPEERCDRKPSSVIHYVDDRQCSYVHDRKCVDTTKQVCHDKQVGTEPKEIHVTECKIEYVEECQGSEPTSYGRQKREASDEDQSREKRQVQNCVGGNCAQNNLGAGGFGAGGVQNCVGGNCGQNNFGGFVAPAGGFGLGGFPSPAVVPVAAPAFPFGGFGGGFPVAGNTQNCALSNCNQNNFG